MSTAFLIENKDSVNASTLSPFMRIARAFRRGRRPTNGREKLNLLTRSKEVPHNEHHSGAPQSSLKFTDGELEVKSCNERLLNEINSNTTEPLHDKNKDHAPLFRASLESLVGSLESIDILNPKSRTIDAELDIELMIRIASKTREIFQSEDSLLQLKVRYA